MPGSSPGCLHQENFLHSHDAHFYAAVAQSVEAAALEAEGWGFDSLSRHHFNAS